MKFNTLAGLLNFENPNYTQTSIKSDVLPETVRAKPLLKKSTLNSKKEVGMGRRRVAAKLCVNEIKNMTSRSLYIR